MKQKKKSYLLMFTNQTQNWDEAIANWIEEASKHFCLVSDIGSDPVKLTYVSECRGVYTFLFRNKNIVKIMWSVRRRDDQASLSTRFGRLWVEFPWPDYYFSAATRNESLHSHSS